MKGAKARELRQAARQITEVYGAAIEPEIRTQFTRNAYKRMKTLFMRAKRDGQH